MTYQLESDIFVVLRVINNLLQICSNCTEAGQSINVDPQNVSVNASNTMFSSNAMEVCCNATHRRPSLSHPPGQQ